MGKLDGKVAIITGTASGIGRATALLFAQEGARIVAADWNEEGNAQTVQDIHNIGATATAIRTNVAQSENIRAMINLALDEFGHIDILMNNAGVGSPPTPIHATDEDDWNRVIDTSLKGVFLGMKYCLPQMMEQGRGNIINMASVAGMVGSPGLAAYAAAKAGVIALTKLAAAEYSRYGVRCNALAPGWTQTPLVDGFISGRDDTRARMLKGVPMRRFGEVDEVANAALFLASDEAQFVQGHTLVIDGGITIV